jgi:hypothetical protein
MMAVIINGEEIQVNPDLPVYLAVFQDGGNATPVEGTTIERLKKLLRVARALKLINVVPERDLT